PGADAGARRSHARPRPLEGARRARVHGPAAERAEGPRLLHAAAPPAGARGFSRPLSRAGPRARSALAPALFGTALLPQRRAPRCSGLGRPALAAPRG